MKTKVLVLLLTFVSMRFFSQNISEGLVTYFDMETSINSVDPNSIDQPPMDMSGLGNHPTNRGANPKGYDYKIFQSSNGYVFNKVMSSQNNVPGHLLTKPGTFNRGKGDYSIALWINIDDAEFTDTNGNPVNGHRDFQFLGYNNGPAETTVTASTKTLAFLKDGKFAALTTNPDNYIVASTPIEWSKWYHYAVVSEYMTHTTKLYVNGQLVAEKSIPNEDVIEVAEANGGILLRRGGGGNVYYYDGLPEGLDSLPVNATHTVPTQRLIFNGMMDEFRLYNRVLTREDIIEIMRKNYASVNVKNVVDDTFKAYGNEYGIVVENKVPATISVYNAIGVLVLNKTIESGSHSISLKTKGLYLVDFNGKVHKVKF